MFKLMSGFCDVKSSVSSLNQEIGIYTCGDNSIVRGSVMTTDRSVRRLPIVWVGSFGLSLCIADPYDSSRRGGGGFLKTWLTFHRIHPKTWGRLCSSRHDTTAGGGEKSLPKKWLQQPWRFGGISNPGDGDCWERSWYPTKSLVLIYYITVAVVWSFWNFLKILFESEYKELLLYIERDGESR